MNNLLDITLKSDNLNQDKIEIQKQVKQEYKLIDSCMYFKGHILFEFNKETKEIKPAKFKCISDTIEFNHNPLKKREVFINQNCFYIQALNRENAIKKLRKIGFNI